MAKLFGIDIAATVAKGISDAGGVRPGILTRVTPGARTAGSLTGGTNPTETTFSFRGFVETKERRRSGQVGASTMSVVTILGDTVTVVPDVNDRVAVDGVNYTLLELLSRDPAEAVYQFRAEE